MHLRKVELHGFKSFADKTQLQFDGGVTAIIGPNGCGKSNVVDAIRWVLGEQSAKSLRAAAMGDCIFAGTASRKPLGYAEVTLTFDNTSGRLPVECAEVAVCRRVYGSGEGEYLINGRPCRLRDMRELFAGTGVGTTAYSIIEQGEITRIISSDPKELRAVFDEAAGICLYKSRLRAALLKLDRVNANLLRAGDIIAEVEKSLRSVKYQAAKAERYRTLSGRLKELKLDRARRAFAQLTARQRELAAALSARRADAEAASAELVELEAKEDAAGARIAAIDAVVAEVSSALAALEAEAGDLVHRIDICRERIGHHRENESKLSAEIEGRREELAGFEVRAVELERRTKSIQARTDRASRVAAQAMERERGMAGEEERLAADLGRSEAEAVEAMRAGTKLQNRLSELAAQERAAGHERERLSARRTALDGDSAAAAREKDAACARKAEASGQVERRRDELGGVRSAKSAAEAARAAVEKDLSTAGERLAGLTSRRELLEDLQNRREGVSNASRAVLEMNVRGTRGLVGELLDVPREFAPAVEALLGDDAGAVVVDSTSAAVEAIRALSQKNAGRAKVISLERAARCAADARDASGEGLDAFVNFVRTPDGCQALIAALLGDCRIAADLKTAARANGASAGLRIATRAGEVVGRDGGIAGGKAGAAGGIVWRKTEIEALRSAEAEARGEISKLEGRRDDAKAEAARLAEEESALQKAIAEGSAEIARLEGEIAAASNRAAQCAREGAVVESEVAGLEKEIATFGQEREAVKAAMEEARGAGAELEARIANLKADRAAATERRDRIRAHVTHFKVRLASMLEKQASLERQYSDATAILAEKAQALERATADIAAARAAAAAETDAMNAGAGRLSDAEREANAARIVLAARRRESAVGHEEATLLAPAIKDARARHDEAREAVSALCVEEREVSVRLADVIARAQEEFGATTADLAMATAQALSVPESGTASCAATVAGTDADNSAETASAQIDPAAIDAEIEELNRKISSLGGVNMEALAQLDELQTRHSFLAGQRDDLEKAKASLESIVEKTRATSRKMFMESFEAVKEHFAAMFRRLFGGGRAECILLDEADVLESPIQITAKPPGKEPSNLNLLSGGEKAMTAVALLFAMFATRPSPFLVLDEVDAPLDESNIGRFIELMNDFLPTSQFVVITHNRRTMAAASTLYGITMEEQGVSKKVSVSLRPESKAPAQAAEPATV